MSKTDIIVAIFVSVFCIIYIYFGIKGWRADRRKFPTGKVAIRNFYENVDYIHKALTFFKKENISFYTKGVDFTVSIAESNYTGLEYETTPMYSNKAVCINDEFVAIIHIIKKNYIKKIKYLELSSKRKKEEIEELVAAAGKIAKELLNDYHEKHPLFPKEETFFSKEEN
jgi:hypothetical protein